LAKREIFTHKYLSSKRVLITKHTDNNIFGDIENLPIFVTQIITV